MAFRGPWDDPSDKRVLGAIGEATGEPTGWYDTSLVTVTWTDSTPDRTLTLTPVNDTFIIYVSGVKYLKRTESVQITDTEGQWSIYYDTNGVLTASQTFPTSLTDNALVWVGYWDATNSAMILETGKNELHGTTMGGSVHQYLHHAFGAQFESGMALGNLTTDGDGSSQDHITFSVASGEFHDEDREIVFSDGSPQDLSPIVQIPVFYLEGASPVWRKQAASNFAIILDGVSGRAAYNENSGGTWQQTAVTSNQFTLVHVFATNDVNTPIIAIQGQGDYTTKIAASAGADTELAVLYVVGLPLAEWIPVATLIVQTKDAYTNSQKSRYVTDIDGADYIDWRVLSPSQTVGASVSSSITAGDSGVEVVDAGVGTIDFTIDGTLCGQFWKTGNDLVIENPDTSGRVFILAADSVDSSRNMILCDPDVGVSLYHGTDNVVAFATRSDGANFRDAEANSSFIYVDTDGQTSCRLWSTIDSRHIIFKGQDAVSATVTMIDADPDGPVELYHDATRVFRTQADGIHVEDGTDECELVFVTGDFYVANNHHGGQIILNVETTAGAAWSPIICDPDAGVKLSHATNLALETYADGIKVYDPDIGSQITIGFGGNNAYFSNKVNAGLVYITGDATGGAVTNLFVGDPDGSVDLYYDGNKIVETSAAGLTSVISATELVVPAAGSLSIKDGDGDDLAIFISNGESRLYHNNVQAYITTSTGGEIKAGSNKFSFVNIGSENYIQTNEHGAPFGLRAENASGSAKKLFDADPDGELYYNGVKATETIDRGISSAKFIYVGVDNSENGIIRAYGDETVSDNGGQLALYTAADHDTTIDYYNIQAHQDDLRIGPDTDPDALKYDADTNGWDISAAGGLKVTNTLQVDDLKLLERSSDPAEPAEGEAVIWMSDGTGKGDDGDVLIASKAGGTTKWGTLFDHSAGAAW
jgi:hypothetical protein